MTKQEIIDNAPKGATHYRLNIEFPHIQAHFYKKEGDDWLWYSWAGTWKKSKLNDIKLINLYENDMSGKFKDLEINEAGSYIKNIDDVKDYLSCVIQEDNTLDDVKYSIEILNKALERLLK